MSGENSIGLYLAVHNKVWIVVEDGCVPEVQGALQLGQIIYTKDYAEEVIRNGYNVVEVDWCRFQSLLEKMRL